MAENIFMAQFRSLGYCNEAMDMVLWLFRNQTLLIKDYNGFLNPRSMILDKLPVWAQVYKLPDNFLKDPAIRGMHGPLGEIVRFISSFQRGLLASLCKYLQESK